MTTAPITDLIEGAYTVRRPTPARKPAKPLRWKGNDRSTTARVGVLVLGVIRGEDAYLWDICPEDSDIDVGVGGGAPTMDKAKAAAVLAARKIANDILNALEGT